MKLKDLKELVDTYMDSGFQDCDIVIKVFSPGSMGGTPVVHIDSINKGFDWDSNKIIIKTKDVIKKVDINEKREDLINSVIK